MPRHLNSNVLYAELVIEEFRRCGASYFVFAPGARNSPLIYAIAHNDKILSVTHFDERGAGYCALGLAKSLHQPVVLICTSGTALANYTPAVIEASYSFVPLLVVSADRPGELVDTGANQTIMQHSFFGNYVRKFFELPPPDTNLPPEIYLSTVDYAVQNALSPTPGPVHINWHIKEPLLFISTKPSSLFYSSRLKLWANSEKPFTTWLTSTKAQVSNEVLDKTLEVFKKHLPSCVVVGELSSSQETHDVLRLGKELRVPVYPDISSGLRLGIREDNIFSYCDLALSSDLKKQLKPEGTVLYLGGRIVSKNLQTFINEQTHVPIIHIHPIPTRIDPGFSCTFRVVEDITSWVRALMNRLKTVPLGSPESAAAKVKNISNITKTIETYLDDVLFSKNELTEPAVCRKISRVIPKDHKLFLGNSLPIREMNLFASVKGNYVQIYANRGASGIDGNIATAVGIALAHKSPLTALIGDLTCLHDLNSLALLRKVSQPFVLVVFNNNGGGIFHFLEMREAKEIFQPFFIAPHDLHLQYTAKMFDITYKKPQDLEEFCAEYQTACHNPHPTLIEIQTDAAASVNLSHQIRKGLNRLLRDISGFGK